MLFPAFQESPFLIQFSFGQLIDRLERALDDPLTNNRTQLLEDLQQLKNAPALLTGITDYSQISDHLDRLRRLLIDYFPPALTLNEIKAVTLPYTGIIFNHTKRFENILADAGEHFDFRIRDFDDHQFYVLSCCLILNQLYGTNLDFSKPLFYDIPMANGVIKHYRILYNGDFLEISPTPRSVHISREDIDQLMDSYDDIDLWKRKFPAGSYILKGFAIMTLVDVTIENAVSLFKEKLLTLQPQDLQESVETIFRSIFKNPRIRTGLTLFDESQGVFQGEGMGFKIKSFLLNQSVKEPAKGVLCDLSFHELIENKKYFAISDSAAFQSQYPDSVLVKRLISQGIRSAVFAPIVKNRKIFAVLEVVSSKEKELNSINAFKLDVIMPFLTDTIESMVSQFQNRVQAVIQRNYTSLHPSVYWRFRDAAREAINNDLLSDPSGLPEIVFENVFPLYGQIDIKGSSDARNEATRKDLLRQLTDVYRLVNDIASVARSGATGVVNSDEAPQDGDTGDFKTTDYSTVISHIGNFISQLAFPVHAGTEQLITHYLGSDVHGLLDRITDHPLTNDIIDYFYHIDKQVGDYHYHRRLFDSSVKSINEKMAAIIDDRQVEAQQIFPHYFERFKTDGLDHSLYIGDSIAPGKNLSSRKLDKLRLWQLRTLCEMEKAHFLMRDYLPIRLEVTTLILLYTQPLAIRFRMDEKRFDVDGSYNARYEIIKKRIDKAYLKGTRNRLTEPGSLAIVFADEEEAKQYRSYLNELQLSGMIQESIEELEVQDLQGVTGLKALRVKFQR
ncbi:GAF domain-containing protein [Flavitalea antarctica]